MWRDRPPLDVPEVAALRDRAADAPGAAGRCGCPPTRPAPPSPTVTGGPAFAALDDFTLATPSLEDVYLALGGRRRGW